MGLNILPMVRSDDSAEASKIAMSIGRNVKSLGMDTENGSA